ncbi:putative mitochondrially-localized peptidyl-trna hydrolase [Golovinomyces cichoracearum]|uniref:peptidyl-tRNA hydrolase n=1 Tax=Golovinomyces cichoracearum TaxID=62708 RepID=A0A420IYB6_9PEZI|nr:putative mitochondrially-localized peptidyl-trna hydrolase [Golovinomyces cichoracearum]
MTSIPATAPTAMLVGTAIVAGISGYFIGVVCCRREVSSTSTSAMISDQVRTANYEDEKESEEEDVDLISLDHAPNWENSIEEDKKDGLRSTTKKTKQQQSEPTPNWEEKSSEECKIAAQCSHAALACYKRFLFSNPTSPTLRSWERQGQAKITLQVKSEDELISLQAVALSLGIVAEIITDAGRTQIESGSHTVLGIGPAPKSIIDQVTGNLKLL